MPSLYGDKQEVVQDTKVTITWQQPDLPKVVDGELICPGHGWGFKLNGGTCDRHNSKIRCEEIYENN